MTYEEYILYLTNKARGERLSDCEAGILRADGQVKELKAEIEQLEEWKETAHHAGIDAAEQD